MKAYLSRRETFSASHRLLSQGLSEKENRDLFGKCFHPNGHGHNYEMEVTLRGEVDPGTGLLMNLEDLKNIIRKEVIEKVDHKYLNLDVEEFKNINPTAEMMAVVFFQWLSKKVPLLYEVKVRETENNVAYFRGEE